MSEKRELFEAFAEQRGKTVDELDRRWLDLWHCSDCEVSIPVHSGDPQAYGPVMCPDCGAVCEVESLQ